MADVPAPHAPDPDDGAAPASDRSRVRRLAHLGHYDRTTIDAVLDAGLVAHVGVTGADGHPVVVPCAYARIGDRVVLHGSVASRLMRTAASGTPLCLTVTVVDGLVVARSLFESSMRYRSVMVLGRATPIDDPGDKLAAVVALSDRLIPGRVGEARGPDERELAATRLVAIDLREASAKVSDGWPDDRDDDVAGDRWAGVVPLERRWGPPVAAPDLASGIAVPPSVSALADDPRFVRPE